MAELEREQEDLLAQLVEGGRDVPRGEREWVFINYGQGSFLQGPGIGREDVPQGDITMLEREGFILAVRYSPRDGNPTYVITPEGLEHYAEVKGRDPIARQEAEVHRFLDSERFRTEYPKAYGKWVDSNDLLWRADSDNELTTVGHKTREALQDFTSEAIARYQPPDAETNPALVNKRLGAVIALLLPKLGEKRAELLRALGDYSEATLGVIQRQEHGGQKEGEDLNWHDARRAVFQVGSVMYECAELFQEASSGSD